MTLALLWTSRGAGVGVVSSMGGGADEGPAIGAGPVVSVVASASADVAAVAVVSASVSVATTSVVCCITANTLVRSASSMLEIQSGAVGFEVNPPRHELADA
ncbi:unnamed protein product, partial [Closterium sp. NIES-54]